MRRSDAVPEDALVPALAADAGVDRLLAALGLGRPEEVRVAKYHPGSRCTFYVAADGRALMVKVFAEDPAGLVRLLERLGEAGFATGDAPTVPPLLGYEPALAALVTPWIEAPAARDLLARGGGRRAGELAAAWLRATATLEADVGDRYGPAEVLDEAVRWTRTLARADGMFAGDAETVRALLAASPPAEPVYTLRHGSFSASHVLDLDGPCVIDWDTHRRGALELDAGMFLAALSRLVGGRRRLAGEAEQAARAFRLGVGDLVDHSTLEWYRGAMLLKLSKYLANRRPRRWRERAHELLGEAAAALRAR